MGAWIRYTVHKRPGQPPSGSLWCTVFDASAGAPFMHKHTTTELTRPGERLDRDRRRLAPGTRRRRGRVRPGALVAALQLERVRAAPPKAELAVQGSAAAHQAHEPGAGGELHGHDRLEGPTRTLRAGRVAGHGRPQLGLRARRALDLAARDRLRGGSLGMARRGARPRARRWTPHAVDGKRRDLAWRAGGCASGRLGARGLKVAESAGSLHALAARRGGPDRRSPCRYAAGRERRMALRRSRRRRARRRQLLGGGARAQRAPARRGGPHAAHRSRRGLRAGDARARSRRTACAVLGRLTRDWLDSQTCSVPLIR